MKRARLVIGTLITVGLLAVLMVPPTYAAPAFDPPGLDRAIAAQEAHTDTLLRIQGVVGTAVGLADGGPVVKIFTEHPGVPRLPRTLDGVPVEVQVTGKLFALHHCKGKHAEDPSCSTTTDPPEDPGTDCSTTDVCPTPVPPGVSTGNEAECSAGTIAARVKAGGNVYALSNNHVYALENQAAPNDPNSNKILQPGRYDTNCDSSSNNVIGTLYDYAEIMFGGFNTMDAAIAVSSTEILGNATPSDGYGTPKSAIVAAAVGMPVQKYGRTTQLTKGTITGINAIVNVGYSSGTALFVNQIIVESFKPFIKAGDSGSLLVTDPGRNPVGLLFAGNRSGKMAIANRIDLVLDHFGVTIDGE